MHKKEALAEAKEWLRNLTIGKATERLGALTDGKARGFEELHFAHGEKQSRKSRIS